MHPRAKLSFLAKKITADINLPRLFGSPETSLTTILFHHFFSPGESRESGRERLRRQLDWLCSRYTPVSPRDVPETLSRGALPKFPVLVTIDDANVEYPIVEDLFRAFRVPVLMFVCAGWSDIVEPHEPGAELARIIALLQWGDSVEQDVEVPGLSPIRLGAQHRAARTSAIDRLIAARDGLSSHYGELADRLQRALFSNRPKGTCSWSELRDLARAGTTMGCHSVSHVRLSRASDVRMAYEIGEARKIIADKFGECEHFAYPFGTPDSFNEKTTAEIERAGFACAFLTHAEFADAQTDRYHLPRLVIPDHDVSAAEFRAIVEGGGILFDRAKRMIHAARA
jgi:peptidoglycan/xylan/chitin deacetylase (PgdA/CDA1 family)